MILASLDRFQKNSSLGSPLPAFGGKVTTPAGYLAALWMHECGRVFCDKTITHEDKAWVDGAIRDLGKCGFCLSALEGHMMRASAVPAYLISAQSWVHRDEVESQQNLLS